MTLVEIYAIMTFLKQIMTDIEHGTDTKEIEYRHDNCNCQSQQIENDNIKNPTHYDLIRVSVDYSKHKDL